MAVKSGSRQCLSNNRWKRSVDWEKIRTALFEKRICDLGLRIKGSPIEPFVQQLEQELAAKGLNYKPWFYLTDSWGCPDRVPAVGIPFYLACQSLAQIEREQTGSLENDQIIMQFLRHEVGHAINYAFRLWKEPGWRATFGSFSKPYRDVFYPNPWSRRFVRHICSFPYRYTYAQKHPDEDFAETFAVWLTPRSGWRRKYRGWPAIQKLKYVDRLMRRICDQTPKCKRGKLVNPISKLTWSLAEHYRRQTQKYGKTG
ncbi:MAG TPA: putative zinc-binding metallopeptidase, partial [Sedimentisphaerales bacterium]|nr:putative zinc-binding metallopeptidase [Sedimentisphaerales bacterium]